MARLTSIARGGYYPFPPEHLPAVASLFGPATMGGLVLDPCAGEGEALKARQDAPGAKADAPSLPARQLCPHRRPRRALPPRRIPPERRVAQRAVHLPGAPRAQR